MQSKSILFCLGLFWLTQASAIAQHVEIRFRGPTLSTTTQLVRLQDIAELSGGDPALRNALAKLDIETISPEQTSIEVSAEVVRYRILLAGVSDSRFHIEPGSSVRIFHWQPEKIDRLIEQSVHAQFVEQYRVPVQELEVDLISEHNAAIIRSGLELNSLDVVADLPADLPLGQRSLSIQLGDGQGRSLQLNAICRVTLFREVAMVRTAVAKGQALSEENLERVRRPINRASIQLASYEEVVGKRAQTDLQPYSVVNQQALREQTATTAPTGQTVMKRNSYASIRIEQGNLSVTLKNAKAQANGQIGETIPFTNPVTGKTFYATITDANSAVIQR